MRIDLRLCCIAATLGCAAELGTQDNLDIAASLSTGAIRPVADGYVRSGSYARKNYGTTSTLVADDDAKHTIKQAYLRFDVPDGALSRAVLRLYVTSSSTNAVDIFAADPSWEERKLTWNTRPSHGGAAIASLDKVSAKTWVEVDVTAAASPGAPLSLALVPRSSDEVAFSSRERSSGKPELVLTFDEPVIDPPSEPEDPEEPPPEDPDDPTPPEDPDDPTPPPSAPSSGSRGYLTTPGELAVIRSKAAAGKQPYRAAADRLSTYVQGATYWPYAGWTDSFDRDVMDGASTLIYAKALAYHIKGDEAYAASARERLLELATSGLGGGGDDLGLARHVPGFIAAADLLEPYAGWSAADKRALQDWLRGPGIYGVLDEVSHERANNWGFMGSGAAAYVADYLAGSGLLLTDRNGKQITAAAAWAESNLKGVQRMDSGDGEMSCGTCPGMTGIWPSGRIPHETGRGSTGCNGEYLVDDDSSLGYMVSAANGLVRHAELLLRRGDSSMYDHITGTGRGSLLRAIRYVIDNPTRSWPWDSGQMEVLEPAYRYYRHPAIGAELGVGGTRVIASPGSKATSGPNGFLDFTTLTHGFAPDETPGPVPTVAPPQ